MHDDDTNGHIAYRPSSQPMTAPFQRRRPVTRLRPVRSIDGLQRLLKVIGEALDNYKTDPRDWRLSFLSSYLDHLDRSLDCLKDRLADLDKPSPRIPPLRPEMTLQQQRDRQFRVLSGALDKFFRSGSDDSFAAIFVEAERLFQLQKQYEEHDAEEDRHDHD